MFDKKQTNFDKKANCIFETEKDKITKHSLFANLKKGLNETKLNIFPIVESFYNNTDVIPFEHFKTDYSISENEQRKRAMGKYIFQNSINFDNWIVPIQIKDVFNNIEKLYNDFFEVANQTKYSLNFSDFEYEFESSKMTNFDKILEKREKLQNRTLYIAIPKNPKTKAQNAQSYKNDILLTNKYHLLILDNLKTVREIKTFFEKNNSLVNIFDCQNISESNPNLIVSDLQTPINKDLLTYCHLTVFENTVDTNFILSFLKTCIDKKIESVWKSIYLRFSFAPKESVLNEILELCEKLEIRVFGILPKNFTSKTLCFFSSYELVNDNDNFTKIELSLSDTNNLSRYKYACKQSYYFTEKYHRITFAENYIPTIDIIRNNTDLIRYIFDNHKYIQIKAMTGLGKTYSVKYALSKILYRLGYTVVFAAPRNAIALQQSENKKYVCFVGANNEKAINQMESSKGNPFGNIVFSNYDNIQLAIETVRMHNKKPFLVIDESDQILRDLDFRESQMKKVIESIKEVEKTIFISATPIEMDFLTKETFFLELVSTQKPKYEKPILYLMKTKSYVDFLTSQIPLDIALNKRVLVFYDDIKNLRVIQQSLKNDKIESNIFASKELTKTEQNVFNEVLSESNYQWNSSVNVILTTQVISAGINIETDKETVIYDLNTNTGFDNDKTVQDFSRIRNYDKHSMKYIILTNNQKGFRDNEFLNYGYHFHSELEFAKDNVEMLNNNLNKNASKHGLGFAIEKANRFTDVLLVDFDKELKKFVLSESKLYALKYKTIVENGSPYFFDLKEIQTFDEIETNENNKAIKLFLKNNQTEIEKDVCNLFLNNFETLLSVTKKHTKDNRLKLIITQIVGANEYSEIDFISTENDYFGSYLLVMEKLLENYFSMFETEISKLNYDNNEYKKLFIEKVESKKIESESEKVESESEKTESFLKIKSKNDMKKDKEKYRNLSIFIKKEKYEKAEKEKQKDFVLSSSEMQTYNYLKNIIDIVSESENHIDSELLKKVNYQKRNSDRLKSYKMFEYLNYFFDIKQSKKNIQIVSKKDVQIEFESLTDIEL